VEGFKVKSKFRIEKKLIAQVRFYEELHCIRDQNGETIFAGTPEMAQKILKMLNAQKRKAKR
jgi:hypothetical protein